MPIKKIILIFTLLIGVLQVSAQNEGKTDSIQSPPIQNIKMFGDFMLDMNILAPPPKLPSFSSNMLWPDATKDYSLLFQLPSQMTLSGGTYIPSMYSSIGYGYGIFPSSNFLQSATFRLNDNMRLTTYGQYTLDGRKIPNPSALPWEKDNFMGGMELKVNKNFGIRIEVQKGHNPMYPY